jgi:hypothetical protein
MRVRSALSVVLGTVLVLAASTLAGRGVAAGAPAASPPLGSVFIVDAGNTRVVEVPGGGGPQTTVGASGLNEPTQAAVDVAGDVFIADDSNNRVVEVPANGGAQTTVGTGLDFPNGVAVDAAGNVYIADTGHQRVVEVPASGAPQFTVGTGFVEPVAMAVDASGDVFVVDLGAGSVVEVPADGGAQTTLGSSYSNPIGIAVDAAGDVFVADEFNNRVVELPADGGAQTTVGSGFSDPTDVALDASGDIFIADDGNNRVVKLPAGGGVQSTVGSGLSGPQTAVVYAPAPVFAADTPPVTATVGTTYSYAYRATAVSDEPAPTFRVTSGALPPGLDLNPATGLVSGTATTAGSFTFRMQTENVANGTVGPRTTIKVSPAKAVVRPTKDEPVLLVSSPKRGVLTMIVVTRPNLAKAKLRFFRVTHGHHHLIGTATTTKQGTATKQLHEKPGSVLHVQAEAIGKGSLLSGYSAAEKIKIRRH